MADEKRIRRNYEQLLNKNHNRGIITLICIMLAGYIFFFMSPIIFHETPVRQYSNLHTDYNYLNGTISVDQWTYSPEQQMFKICCSFSDAVNLKDVEVSAVCNFSYRSKSIAELNADLVYSTRNYIVALVNGIPEDWYCASLRITNNSTTQETISVEETEHPKQNSDGLHSLENVRTAETKTSSNTGSVYTCIDGVEQVSEIKAFDNDNEYAIERNERNITYDEQLIAANKVEIENLEKSISDCKAEIEQINDEKAFQVEAELKASNTKISNLEKKIETSSKLIESLKTRNEALETEIDDYNIIIRRLRLKQHQE